jgi:hypothetical protein
VISARGHRVDYAWWSTHAREGDHCLRGSLRGADVRAAAEAIEGFLRGLEQYPAEVDGVSRMVAVEGGMRTYAVAADSGSGDGLDLYLHSSGEDATDTLCHYSREVAAIVRRAGGDGRLTWTQLPADRPDHLLRF